MQTLDAFTQAYIAAALWSSTDDDGIPLDRSHDDSDLASETLQRMIADCAKFQADNPIIFTEAYSGDAEQAGHDFWLTRNGHGVGFWDRGDGEVGEQLTKAAHDFGEVDLYTGDDGKLYLG